MSWKVIELKDNINGFKFGVQILTSNDGKYVFTGIGKLCKSKKEVKDFIDSYYNLIHL